MSKQREALEIALEVLDSKHNFQSAEWRHMHYKAFQIIREVLAEPEQELICDKDPQGCWNVRCQLGKVCKNTTPPTRQPLTDEKLWEMWVESPSDVLRFARAIERAHGITE